MEKLMLVDGSNLLFQMFYGMPARIMGANGKPIHGVLGFLGALLKLIRMTEPTHLGVIFDGECANERTELDPGYKANRPDYGSFAEEDTPFSQLPELYRVLKYLGIAHWETTDCEADDQIAGYALRYGGEGKVVIVSQDSDFFQLITDSVMVLRYRGKQSVICDPAYLRQKLGIDPSRYADFKALTGDKADNIPGIPGIGPKTAAMLLNRFGDLDTLLAQTDTVSRPSHREALRENAERLKMNHRLICLQGAENLPAGPEALRLPRIGSTTTEILKQLGLL